MEKALSVLMNLLTRIGAFLKGLLISIILRLKGFRKGAVDTSLLKRLILKAMRENRLVWDEFDRYPNSFVVRASTEACALLRANEVEATEQIERSVRKYVEAHHGKIDPIQLRFVEDAGFDENTFVIDCEFTGGIDKVTPVWIIPKTVKFESGRTSVEPGLSESGIDVTGVTRPLRMRSGGTRMYEKRSIDD